MQWRQHELAHVAELTGARFCVAADTFKGTTYLDLMDKLPCGKHHIEHRVGLAEVRRWAGGRCGASCRTRCASTPTTSLQAQQFHMLEAQ